MVAIVRMFGYRNRPVRLGASVVAIGLAAASCASTTTSSIPPIPPIETKSAKELCAETGYDPNVVVYRDSSSQFRLAAVGVTASGDLEAFAAAVGSSVITTRGGAVVMKGGDTDTEVRACDTYK